MCISVLSTAHPDYPFVLVSNRDEFINRPTLRANWWDPPNSQVLGGRDLQRQERGTWLAITKQGRLALLTNFREQGDTHINMSKSRGGMIAPWLTASPDSDETEEDFAQRLMRDFGIHDVGGFTMVFGKLRAPSEAQANGSTTNGVHKQMPGLALVSNRTETPKDLKRIVTHLGETHAVSNSHFGDMSWPKVVHGEKLLKEVIEKDIEQNESQDKFIENLFSILCTDALPTRRKDETWDAYVFHMRNTIMVPPAKGVLGHELSSAEGRDTPTQEKVKLGKEAYGTTKQTVILINKEGKVTFIERTLFEDGAPVAEKERDSKYEFDIEGWR